MVQAHDNDIKKMQKRKLGKSNLEVSAFGLGWLHGHERLLRRSERGGVDRHGPPPIDLGVNFFDTAEAYMAPMPTRNSSAGRSRGAATRPLWRRNSVGTFRRARPVEPIGGPTTSVRSPTHRFSGSASITLICSTSIGSTGPCRWRMLPARSAILCGKARRASSVYPKRPSKTFDSPMPNIPSRRDSARHLSGCGTLKERSSPCYENSGLLLFPPPHLPAVS